MNARNAFAAIWTACLITGLPAKSSDEPPPELKLLKSEFQAQLDDGVLKTFNEAMAKLDASYLTGVERALAAAKSAGQLESALALEGEKNRIYDNKKLPATDDQAAKALKPLRAIYRREMTRLEAQCASGQANLLKPHVAALKNLEVELTKADRLADAKAVMDYRQAIEQGGFAKVAIAEESKPGDTPPIIMSAGSVAVAQEIKAKGPVTGLMAGAFVFDGPSGDGRNGAKGVLLPNDPATGQGVTRWSFSYIRQGSAQSLQIIHPHGPGQAIVHLKQAEIGISTPEAWREAGYGSGDTDRIKKRREFNDVFPLKDGEEYLVISTMDSQGGYELSVNGKVVATARVAKTSPLSFENKPDVPFPGSGRGSLTFSGAGFPMRWDAGYAGLLLGPLDSGLNSVKQVRFEKGSR